MWALLEGYGAQLAAVRITDENVAHLERLADDMERGADRNNSDAQSRSMLSIAN